MKPDCILIRIGEMSLKSEQVNRKWSKILMDNIKYGLKGFDYKIEKRKNRYFIYTNNIDKVSKILQRIFGITSISLCYVCKSNINNIKKKALEVAKNKIKKSQAFAISVKRIDFQDLSSQEIAIKVGDIIYDDENIDLLSGNVVVHETSLHFFIVKSNIDGKQLASCSDISDSDK